MSISFHINNPPRNLYKKVSKETGLSISTVRNILKAREANYITKLKVIGEAIKILHDPS